MATLCMLYRQVQYMLQQRQAEAMRSKHPNARLLEEIEELKEIMMGLVSAHKDAGGNWTT